MGKNVGRRSQGLPPFLFFIEIAFAGEQPRRRNSIVTDKVEQPSRLKDVTFRLFLKGEHIPSVDAVSVRERLLATDFAVGFKAIDCLKKPFYYFLGVGRLHGIYFYSVALFLFRR